MYANLSSDNPVSAIKKDTTSVTVLPEKLTITTDADISSTAPSNLSATTLSSFADSPTSTATGLAQGASTSTTMIDLASWQPKVKQRHIKYDT